VNAIKIVSHPISPDHQSNRESINMFPQNQLTLLAQPWIVLVIYFPPPVTSLKSLGKHRAIN